LAWTTALLAWLSVLVLGGGALADQAENTDGEGGAVWIALRDVQPLHGGLNLYLWRDGAGYGQIVIRRPSITPLQERRYQFHLPQEKTLAVFSLISASSFREIPSSSKPGLPDEGRPEIHVKFQSGDVVKVSRWSNNDPHPAFDAIYRALIAVLDPLHGQPPLFDGQYDPKWAPEGFGVSSADRK
jgi:hypothetical protein